MAKRLSEQLAELSVHAKHAEDTVAAAQKEAHEKIAARREQAHAAATAATEKVNQEVKSVKDAASRDWKAPAATANITGSSWIVARITPADLTDWIAIAMISLGVYLVSGGPLPARRA